MALLDDAVTITLLVSSAFFVALAIGLLVRYRQVSQRIADSSDLGHDLWQALEQRLNKQDERILDMMGRMEVVQARVLATPPVRELPVSPPVPVSAPPVMPLVEEPRDVEGQSRVMQQPVSQVESQESQESQPIQPPPSSGPSLQGVSKVEVELDETQLAAVKLLAEGMKNTRQLTDSLQKSREHTARVMKELFELGLVRRNIATKPFVYQITDEGRHRLESSG